MQFYLHKQKMRIAHVTFADIPQMKINSLKKQKHGYRIHT